MSVEPANFCQLHCPECPVGNKKGENGALINIETFKRVLKLVQNTAHTMQFYFQGEPLLNKQLPEMIARSHQAGLYTIVSTNAQALSKEMADSLVKSGLSRIIVSIDGFSEESYSAYRVGGNLHKALDGLRLLREAKKQQRSSIVIELQVLRLSTNEHEWQWIRKNYKKLGATHLVFKTAQLYNFETGHPLMPTDERYSRYKKGLDGKYYLHRSWLRRKWYVNPCFRLWSGCVITTTGEVLPCCYDKEHRHSLGNLTTRSLSDIFHSKHADALRRCILTGQLPEMCRNCNY